MNLLNISTQSLFYVFYAMAALTVTVLVFNRVRRWRQRTREEAKLREAEYEDALRSSEDVSVEPAQPMSSQQPSPATVAAPATADHDESSVSADVPVTAASAAEASTSVEQSRPGVIRADQFLAWSPPKVDVWQPPADHALGVSWTGQELFGKDSAHFEEPNHIPKVRPDEIPATDSSDQVFGEATTAMSAVMPAPDIERTGKELMRAGYHQPHAMQNLQAVRFMILFGVFFLGGIAMILVPQQFELWVIGGTLGAAALFWSVPRLYLQNRATERTSQLERAMPDMLDMLNMCVSQGLTIPDSLRRISRDLKPVYPVLAQELTIVVHQADVGDMQVALNNFADRVDVPEVDSFVSLMNQSERMGTNVSDALTEYSNTMRESLRQRTDEKANQAAFRLMFPTVLFMMPAVFGFLMGPAIVELQDFFDEGGLEAVRGDGNLDAINTGFRRSQ